MKRVFLILMFVFIIFSIAFTNVSIAGPLQTPEKVTGSDSMEKFANSAGFYKGTDSNGTLLGATIATIIKGFLSLLAIIFIILMLYAGFNWMTAGGDEQKVTQAKETIQKAIIGLIIIISAYTITAFVFKALPFGDDAGGTGGGGASIME